jgi:hypothetical protein
MRRYPRLDRHVFPCYIGGLRRATAVGIPWIARSQGRSLPRPAAPRWIRPSGSTTAKKLTACGHFSSNLRRLSWAREENSGKTSKESIKNGGNWRLLDGQSAI